MNRRYAAGAEVVDGGVLFRVWAPQRRSVEVLIEGAGGRKGRAFAMDRDAEGYFQALVSEAEHGTRYRYRLDEGDAFPDPASRAQPEGPHGPSQVVDPARFRWHDDAWKGIRIDGQVIYEFHVGTFTPEGTWAAAAEQLSELARLGITTLEMMPIADFPGKFGWGYDGVGLWAPAGLYGTPDDLRAFIDRAHRVGLGVILDVVYNHFGPDGNYVAQYSKDYFAPHHTTDWGDAINFDGAKSSAVRDFFADNAAYWISEFHFDGLRLDATQNIYDNSEPHILAEISRRARAAAGARDIVLVGENESQNTTLMRAPENGGYGLDALWNDDFHHAAFVALTGRNEAYFTDTRGTPQEFISAAKWGFLYQGQYYSWQKNRRGSPALDIAPEQFITFLENHDQVANTIRGARPRELTSAARHRAMTALFLLSPGTPMLFQGQEFGASAPFLYFADHSPELNALVRKGRGEFVKQFPSLALPEVQARLEDPGARATFERCKLDFSERETHAMIYEMHRDLIALRRRDPVFFKPRPRGVDGAVLGSDAFVLRFFGEADGDRLIVVNLGRDLLLETSPEPLLAAPRGGVWRVVWASEDPRYGGAGQTAPEGERGWRLSAESLVVLATEVNRHG